MADQLTTTATVKTRLRITASTDDALISSLIDGVSDWIEDETGRKLVAETAATYVVNTVYGNTIYIRRGIRTVTTLSIATTDQPDTGGTYTAVAAAEISLQPPAIERRVGWPADRIVLTGVYGRLKTALNGAQIVGNFGFATVPPAIEQVAIDAVVSAYASRGKPSSATIGSDERAIYPWATFFSTGSPQRATVMRYRGGWGIG
jgi:hypothetical protein